LAEWDFEEAEQKAEKTAGWFVWLGEEFERIWKDGKFLGSMLSCRGSREIKLADGRRFVNWGGDLKNGMTLREVKQ
jgi:hypothetical protein